MTLLPTCRWRELGGAIKTPLNKVLAQASVDGRIQLECHYEDRCCPSPSSRKHQAHLQTQLGLAYTAVLPHRPKQNSTVSSWQNRTELSFLGISMSLKLEAHLFGELQRHVGSKLEILTDPTDARFQEHSKRWSDIDRQTPAAIVLPRSEEHIQSTVFYRSSGSLLGY